MLPFDYDALLQEASAAMPDLTPVGTNEQDVARMMQEMEGILKQRAEEEAKRQRSRKHNAAQRQRDAAALADAAAADDQAAQQDQARFEQEADELIRDEAVGGLHVDEPQAYAPLLAWPQELPDVQLEALLGEQADQLAASISQLTGQPPPPPSEIAALSIRSGVAPTACPSEEAARAVFGAACYAPDPWLAAASADLLLRWCGMSDSALAGEALMLGGLLELEDPPPATSAPSYWLPGAQDLLAALQALGANVPARGGPAAAVQKAEPEDAGARPHHMHGLKQLLRLMAALCRLAAVGNLQLSLPEGHGRQLLLTLLRLQLDPAVRAAALPEVQEASGALMDAFSPTEWARVCGGVAERLAEPLGPSHRSAVRLLQELPGRGERRWQLQQAGGMALLHQLLKKGGGGQGSRARGAPAAEPPQVQALLQGKGSGRAGHVLAHMLGGGGREADYWGVMNVLDAADIILWTAVEQGNRLERQYRSVKEWFILWLDNLVTLLGRGMQWHFVRARISELSRRTYPESGQLAATGAYAQVAAG